MSRFGAICGAIETQDFWLKPAQALTGNDEDIYYATKNAMSMQQQNTPSAALPLDPNRLGETLTRFNMETLVSKTGASPRQIRYWIDLRAVDGPLGRGPSARYSMTHVQQIRDVMLGIGHGQRPRKTAARKLLNESQASEDLSSGWPNSEGVSVSRLEIWHHIAVSKNIYIGSNFSRTDLETRITREMERVAKSMLAEAMSPKAKQKKTR